MKCVCVLSLHVACHACAELGCCCAACAWLNRPWRTGDCRACADWGLLCCADFAELVTQCWAADPLTRPSFTTVMQRLDVMLAALMQDEIEAHERYVSDL
jgi:hypothetical protein